jgi:protein-S-isoprenylcysteine O-methyltransferase Ste14
MIQTIGIIELIIFYMAYFIKLFGQKRRGIKTNQLGIGSKPRKTITIERLLRFSSILIVMVILLSAIFDTSIFSNQIIRGIGLALFGCGTILFILAMVTMKDSWRAGVPDKDSTLIVTSGIYKLSRNPAFLGFDLTYIGACLAYGNILLFLLAVITITLMHLQILEEEKFLSTTFGNEYLIYKSKVGRYFMFF